MSIVKLSLETSVLSANDKDPRLLPMTQRQQPQPSRVKPNKTVLDWGMKK